MKNNRLSELCLGPAASFAALAWLLFCPTSALAVENKPSTVVMMAVGETDSDSVEVAGAVESQLSDLDVELVVRKVEFLPESRADQITAAGRIAGESRIIAVFWYDFSKEGQVYLFLAGPEGDRVLVRKLEQSKDRGRAEGLAIIIRSSVVAMLNGGEIGIAAKAAPEKTEATRQPAAAPRAQAPKGAPQKQASLEVGYAFNARHENHPALSGLEIGMSLKLWGMLGLNAGFAFFQPIRAEGSLASVVVRRHPVHVGLSLTFNLKTISLFGFAAASIDFVDQDVSRLSPGMSEISDMDDVVFGVLTMLGAKLPLYRIFGFYLSVGALAVFNERVYDVELNGDKETLVEAWPVQPCAFAGVSVEFW